MKTSKLALGLVASCVVLFTATQQYAQLERRPPRVVSGFTDIVWSVKFWPDNRTLAIARGTSDAGRVELWDIVSGTLPHHQGFRRGGMVDIVRAGWKDARLRQRWKPVGHWWR